MHNAVLKFFAASAVFLTSTISVAQNLSPEFDRGFVSVKLPESMLAPRIANHLNHSVTRVKDSSTEVADLSNFGVWFEDSYIRVTFDYSAKQRGWTTNPINGDRIYGPWVSDSGWVSFLIKVNVQNWRLSVWTRAHKVTWSSNNWFTNWIGGFIDGNIRVAIADAIHMAIEDALGSRQLDLRNLLADEGAQPLANATGMSLSEAAAKIREAAGNYPVNAEIVNRTVKVGVQIGKAIQFRNSCNRPVKLALRYKKLDGEWETRGWYNIDAGKTTFLNGSGFNLTSKNLIFYYYAETTSGSRSTWSGDVMRDVNGQEVGMKKSEFDVKDHADGYTHYSFGINCN